MDVLADVLAVTRMGGVVLAQLHARRSWGCAIDRLDHAAFHIMAQGTCWLRLSGHPPLQLVQGDVVILPAGTPHTLASTPRGRAIPFEQLLAEHPPTAHGEVHLDGDGPCTQVICGKFRHDHDGPHPVLAQLPTVVHLPAHRATTDTELQTAIRLLAAELTARRPGSQAVIARMTDVLFVYVLRAWLANQTEARPSWLAALQDPQIGAALAQLHAHPDRPWTVESIAAEVHMSRAVFARRFTHLVGDTPLAYLTRWRMDLAARRLRDTDEPIARIAQRSGYTSEYAFSRTFARAHGQPPGRYRRATPASLGAPTGARARVDDANRG